jgi:hypothetical protein
MPPGNVPLAPKRLLPGGNYFFNACMRRAQMWSAEIQNLTYENMRTEEKVSKHLTLSRGGYKIHLLIESGIKFKRN